MIRTILNMLAGALVCAAVGAAFAVTGTPPVPGMNVIDGSWLLGLANGVNNSYQYGITAAGTTQATATALPTNTYLIEVDTTAASTGVNLVPAFPGTEFSLYNNGANTLTLYPSVANNPLSSPSAQDTINNGSSTTLSSHTLIYCMSAKVGIWACK